VKEKNNFSVLIPVGESNLLMFIVHCLSQIKGIKIYILSPKEFAEIKHSNKILNYTYYPKLNTETNWVYAINQELEKFNIDLVIPIDEFGIRTSVKFKNNISNPSKLAILPSLSSFDIANNKGLLWEHMTKNEIPCPKTYTKGKDGSFKDDLMEFPLIIKPLEGFGFGGGRGIKFFNDRESLNYFLKSKVEYSYLIQNYIKGYDIDCSVLCKDGDILAYTIQKGDMMGKSEFAPSIGLHFLKEEKLYRIVEKLMKTLNWSGVAHIDMRYDVIDDVFKVIEINPRFWESTEASEIAGVNFPYLYCLASLNIGFDIPDYKEVKFLNILGLKKKIKNNKAFLFKFKFIKNNTPIKYYLKDPLPFFIMSYYKIKSLF
jgi:D-aspartate ligase